MRDIEGAEMPLVYPRRRVPLAVAALLCACGSGPVEAPDGLAFAAASPDCGPSDGPAVAFYLAPDAVATLPPALPYVRVSVWRGMAELSSEAWAVGGDSPDGAAGYHDGDGGAPTPLRGTLIVRVVLPDSTIEGEVVLQSPTGFTVRGGFRAVWIPLMIRCG